MECKASEEAGIQLALAQQLAAMSPSSLGVLVAQLEAMQRAGDPVAAELQDALATAMHVAKLPRALSLSLLKTAASAEIVTAADLQPVSPPLVAPLPYRPKLKVGCGSSAFTPVVVAQHGGDSRWQAQHTAPMIHSAAPAASQQNVGSALGLGLQPTCHVSLGIGGGHGSKGGAGLTTGQQHLPKMKGPTVSVTATSHSGGMQGLMQAVQQCEVSGIPKAFVQAKLSVPGVIRPTAQRVKPYHLPQALVKEPAVKSLSSLSSAHLSWVLPNKEQNLAPGTAAGTWALAPASLPVSPVITCSQTTSGDSQQWQGGLASAVVHVPGTPPQSVTSSDWSLRPLAGGVKKAKSPSRQLRVPAVAVAESDDTSHHVTWSAADKAALLTAVAEVHPRGARDWENVSRRVGRWCKGGAAERMHRSLSDPSYHRRAGNRHGCRVNARDGTPMHVMVAWALRRLPGNKGNIDQMAAEIESNPDFARQLDRTPRCGTKSYPRYRDAMTQCFKPGRYAHLLNTRVKVNGKLVYQLVSAAAQSA